MPPRGNLAEAKEFAQLHGGWIAARLGRLPKAAPFQSGTLVPLRGVAHRLVHRAGERGTVWTEIRDSGEKSCVSPVAPNIWTAGSTIFSSAKRARTCTSRRWLMPNSSASRSSGCRCAINRAAGVRALRQARWLFSWRLILAPPYVLDYLAADGLAHLVEMNHSARFWKVVARICSQVSAPRAARHPRQRPTPLWDSGLAANFSTTPTVIARLRATIAALERGDQMPALSSSGVHGCV